MDENKVIIKEIVNKIGLSELQEILEKFLLGPVIKIGCFYDKEVYYINLLGEKHGRYLLYHRNGKILSDWNYINGRRHGRCITYRIDGKM